MFTQTNLNSDYKGSLIVHAYIHTYIHTPIQQNKIYFISHMPSSAPDYNLKIQLTIIYKLHSISMA